MPESMNVQTVEDLLLQGGLRLERGKLLSSRPAAKAPGLCFDRVEGMMLGLAIGDALGNPSEGMNPDQRRQRFGEITDYVVHPHFGEARGYPSDDSQLAFWTLEQLLKDGGLVPGRLGRRFARGHIFGIGSTVRRFLANQAAGTPWHQCGPESAGNGALMRVAPLLIPHLTTGGCGLWADVTLGSMLTHNDRCSTASCLAFVAMLWDLLDMSGPPDPGWWLQRYTACMADLEGASTYQPRGGLLTEYQGPSWAYTRSRVLWAEEERIGTQQACDAWYSGAFLLETVPCALLILTRHGHDPEAAIIRAVNDCRDNDTIAAIVGAAVGALHGRCALPARWLDGLSGRTSFDDDGKMFELLDRAQSVFWPGSPSAA